MHVFLVNRYGQDVDSTDGYCCAVCIGSLDSMERGTVEWNSGTVEWWNSGMVE